MSKKITAIAEALLLEEATPMENLQRMLKEVVLNKKKQQKQYEALLEQQKQQLQQLQQQQQNDILFTLYINNIRFS
ncbi:hypothetical protein ALC56_03979 [Trachymyrmex septentrionalis]|uniref:Uncharacterized protein n=1 Tax=Trachymyrmex septentrionalis TaxID=34720 RepID=A0A151JZ41_9HYME|nr:hypothetical protein ALC56_03979 [Trachymyrmex septentrionalis]